MVVQLRTVSGADPAVDDGPAREPHWRRPARQAGLIALGALCLMLAILVNGRPTVFSDTADYFSQARSIVRDAHDAIYKNKPIVSREMFEDHFGRDDQGDEEPIHNELGARSPYYGMFLYTLHRIGTMWLVAAAQAAIIAAAVYGLWRLTLPQAHPRTYLMAMAVLAIGTPLPFIAGFAVPDALTGVAATGGMIFLLYADRLSLTARIVLLAGLAFCFNAHASHIATGLALIICTAALLLFFRYDRRAIALRAACIAGAIAAAMTASAAYAFLVHLRTGDDLRSPPFLSIRVIADGPGREYLRHSCAQDPKKWEMCRFSKLPLRESNTLMWSVDPKVAVFNVSEIGRAHV